MRAWLAGRETHASGTTYLSGTTFFQRVFQPCSYEIEAYEIEHCDSENCLIRLITTIIASGNSVLLYEISS